MNRNRGSPSIGLTILLLVGFAATIHAPFHFGNLYGEQDAARLVNDGLIWSTTDVRSESLSEYRFYISPGYIWLAKEAVQVARSTAGHPAYYLNTLNLLVAILIVVPVFLLFARLVGYEGAVLGTLFLSLVPTFWQSGLYGFPHLPSLLFMVFALLAYDRVLTGEAARVPGSVLVVILLTISILLKADIYLSGVAFIGLLLHRRRLSGGFILATGGLLLVPILVSLAVSHGLLSQSPNALDYLARWNHQYDAAAGRFFSRSGLTGVVRSMGLLSIPLFLTSLVWLWATKRQSLALLLAMWLIVPLAFWVFRVGDSARHHLQASVPIGLGIGVLLGSPRWKRTWARAFLLGLVVANYFAFAPDSSTLRTSGNLARSSQMLRARVAEYHHGARRYAEVEATRKVILGTITIPYVDNEILYGAETVQSVTATDALGYDAIAIEYTVGGKPHVSTSVHVAVGESRAAAAVYRRAGYRVFSIEYDLRSNQAGAATGLSEYDEGVRDKS